LLINRKTLKRVILGDGGSGGGGGGGDSDEEEEAAAKVAAALGKLSIEGGPIASEPPAFDLQV
jgi:hypothetical protein